MVGKALIILIIIVPGIAYAENITTLDVIHRSASTKCLDWKIIGICFWLKCSPKCRIKTTPKIQHNLPDLTATTYPYTSPWIELRYSNQSLPWNLLKSGGDIGRQNLQSSVVKFKEVQVIGNPAAKFRNIFGMPFLCKSKTKPLYKYFDSSTLGNALQWRGEGLDQAKKESWVPGLREIGNWPTNTWGSVYPRIGFLAQNEDPKVGAVIAQRAIDIVTREGQGFDYTALGYSGYRHQIWGDRFATNNKDCHETGGRWIPPNPLVNGDTRGRCLTQRSVQWLPPANERLDKWQMISPQSSNQCETFGSNDDWSAGKESEDGNYVFNYWRKYKCCIPRSGKFLKSVEF